MTPIFGFAGTGTFAECGRNVEAYAGIATIDANTHDANRKDL